MQPTVVMNHHRQTAIIVAKKGNKLQMIKLGKGRLTVASFTAVEIEIQGYKVSHYSPSKAAHAYLQHGAGVSERARKYLEEVTRLKYSDQLALT